ncbi:hypothetical protein [Nonlabens agnitus]|uniref:Uncharacterized protein n=1 Tax=Nonlabens agnitus TaxID=870484 RepID=A0A2S9WXA8_9FLAO|nr:hypothetical protein [Nonlabens agnitus]PRP68108.1 hypothetical protein BST86_13935 [Nonlabens agnitus]
MKFGTPDSKTFKTDGVMLGGIAVGGLVQEPAQQLITGKFPQASKKLVNMALAVAGIGAALAIKSKDTTSNGLKGLAAGTGVAALIAVGREMVPASTKAEVAAGQNGFMKSLLGMNSTFQFPTIRRTAQREEPIRRIENRQTSENPFEGMRIAQ